MAEAICTLNRIELSLYGTGTQVADAVDQPGSKGNKVRSASAKETLWKRRSQTLDQVMVINPATAQHCEEDEVDENMK
jgi:hypothetical protein